MFNRLRLSYKILLHRRWNLFLQLLIIFFVNSGCITDFKPKQAVGKITEIIVVAEDTTGSIIDTLTSLILERNIYTPTTEQVFNIKKITPHEFQVFKYRRSHLVVGLLGEPFIDSILTQKAIQSLLTGEAYIFGTQDFFIKGQQLLVVATPTIYKLKEVMETNKDLIFNFFMEGVLRTIREDLYSKGYQEDKSRGLKEKYGFAISIPKGWITAEDKFGFVEFIRHSPDRIISIYWEANPTLTLSKNNAIAMRDKIGVEHFDGDYVDTTRTNFYSISFHNLTAGKLDGIWQNDKLVMGGPFRTYIFSSKGRVYIIDMHIFAPGEKKWKWLQQLEVIVDTFED